MTGLALFLCVLLPSVFTGAVDQTDVTAAPRENVTLPCQALSNTHTNILYVKWIRLDLKMEYVFFYRDGQFDSDHQHPSFKDRVELKDSDMKNGDASLILRNVTKDDAGIYECHVKETNKRYSKTKPLRIINLNVTGHTSDPPEDGGNKGGRESDGNNRGHIGLIASLLVFCVTLLCLLIFITCRRIRMSFFLPVKEVANS